MLKTKTKIYLLLFLFSASTMAAVAEQRLKRDSNAPINIQADHMKYEFQTGISEYTGNVLVTQSDLELTGDKVIAIRQNKVLQNITVTGSPASYRQLSEDGSYIKAQSQKMEFQANKSRLVLTKKARLEQAGSVMESDQIIYDTVNEVVIAGDENAKKRVNITITPENIKKQ